MKSEKRVLKIKDADLRIKGADTDNPMIVGYAAVFDSDSEDLGGFTESIAPGAFRNVIKVSDTIALFNHDSNLVLGRQGAGTLRLKEDNIGLHMEIDPPDTQYARDLMISIGRGDVTKQSFGFVVGDDSIEKRANGEIHRRINTVAELFDVSPVTFPAYPDTTVALRSLDLYKQDLATEAQDSAIAAENEDIEIDLLINNIGSLT